MTPRQPQDLAIGTTVSDLIWCSTEPHTIDHIATLSANRFPRTRWRHGATTDEMAASIYNDAQSDEYGPPPPWSDPTGEAVAAGRRSSLVGSHIDTNRGAPTAPSSTGDSGDDPTPSAIDSALDLIYWSADELAMLTLDGQRIGPRTDRETILSSATSLLHQIQPAVIGARDRQDRLGRDHIDLLVYQHLSETAEWLRAKGEVLCGSQRKGQPVPQPGDLPKGCVSCARDRDSSGRPHFTAVDEKNHSARKMCRTCGDYYSGEEQMLPLGAVQYMHRTGKNLTWKIIEQAKQSEKAS